MLSAKVRPEHVLWDHIPGHLPDLSDGVDSRVVSATVDRDLEEMEKEQ